MKTIKKPLLPFLFILLLSASACNKKKDQVSVKVQAINASFNSPYLDYYLNNDLCSQFVGYCINTNSFTADLSPGDPIVAEMKDPDSNNQTVASVSFTDWQVGIHYAMVLYDDYAQRKVALLSDSAVMPNSDTLLVRFMNFAPDAPPLDLYFNNIPIATNIPYYGTDSLHAVSSFIALPKGTYTVVMKEHQSGTVRNNPFTPTFDGNRILTFYATGTIADTLTHHITLAGGPQ